MPFSILLLAAAQAAEAAPVPVAPPQVSCDERGKCSGLSASDVLKLAELAVSKNEQERAQNLLLAVTRDPDPEYRAEARFRLGRLCEARKDLPCAERWYRALLDEKPNAASVRLELGRVLAQQDKTQAAAREMRRAQAAGIPEAIARDVARIVSVLRSTAPFGGSVEVSLAPDTNINRATRAETIEVFGLPFELGDGSREKSGVGLAASAQAFVRQPLFGRHRFSAEVTAVGNFYRESDFSDLNIAVSAGPEFQLGSLNLRPAAIASRTWFGGDPYSKGYGVSLMARKPIGRTAALSTQASVQHLTYNNQPALDGHLYLGQVAVEKALSARLYARVSATITRNDATSPTQAYWSYGSGLTLSRQFGRMTGYAGVNYRRLDSDAAFFLFGKARDEDFVELNAGLILRQINFRGLSPVLRFSHARNMSPLSLYDYTRNRAEIGLTRDF